MADVEWRYAARKLETAREHLMVPVEDEVEAVVDAMFEVSVAFAGVASTDHRGADRHLHNLKELMGDAPSRDEEGRKLGQRDRWRRRARELTPVQVQRFSHNVAELAAIAKRRARSLGEEEPDA